MLRSAVAILTYRRLGTLNTMMSGLQNHCGVYRSAIFEDCGQRDGTADFLQAGRRSVYRPELMAYEYEVDDLSTQEPNYRNTQVFMGERNLGVAANSNRALRWFMEETNADHLCLCNDDLHVDGDFVKFYAKGHEDLGTELFCFSDFTHHESYKWTTYRVRGYGVKFLGRMTGIMMSMRRSLVDKIGYYDAAFGKFGEEHCDFNIRARFSGGVKLENSDMACLDLEHPFLRHQECATSVVGQDRELANVEASAVMNQTSENYRWRHNYRPFRLALPRQAGGYSGGGISVENLLASGYRLVTALA